MVIVENGPNIVQAEKLLTSALDHYLRDNSVAGIGHFCHESDDIRSYGAPSKTVQKYWNFGVKLSSMARKLFT